LKNIANISALTLYAVLIAQSFFGFDHRFGQYQPQRHKGDNAFPFLVFLCAPCVSVPYRFISVEKNKKIFQYRM
jgi:hypothetical protein